MVTFRKKNKLKIIRISLMIISLLITLPSCAPNVQLSKRGLIQSIGIDYKNNMFTVSFQMFNAASSLSSSSGGESSSSKQNIVISSKGRTLVDAMKKSYLKQDRKIYYRLNEVIILGNSIVKNKQVFKETIAFLNHVYMSSPHIYVVVSKKEASEIIEAEISQHSMPSNFIQEMIKNAEKQSYIQRTYLSDLVSSLNNIPYSISIPIISKEKTKDDKDELIISKVGILKNGTLQGELDTDQMKYFKFLENKKSQLSFSVESEEYGLSDFNVVKKNVKIKPSIKNNHPHFDIKLDLINSLLENSKGLDIKNLSEKEIKNLENLQKQELEKNIKNLIITVLRSYKSDVFYFSNDIYRKYPEYFIANKNNWSDILLETTFSLDIKNHIYRSTIEKSKNY